MKSTKNIKNKQDPQAYEPYGKIKEDELKIENDSDMEYIVRVGELGHSSCLKKTTNSGCSRRESAKNSTAKYRQKKKLQLIELQKSVKNLQTELYQTDNELQQVKQNILTGLQTLAKMNQRNSNQNTQIYVELENIVGKCVASNSLNKEKLFENFAIDFDKINLLLDTLKYRIGASGRQRQSKLTYHYKSIVNTLFPALYRYLLLSNIYQVDFFKNESFQKGSDWQWTEQLMKKLNYNEDQMRHVKKYESRLENVFSQTLNGVKKLNEIKEALKRQGQKVEGIQQQIRQILNPLQCARWIIFADKYKYRKELLLDSGFLSLFERIKQQQINGETMKNCMGQKKVKLSKD